MEEQILIKQAGRELELLDLLPTESATAAIPVEIDGFILSDLHVPPAELPETELTTHLIGVFRNSPPCVMCYGAEEALMYPGSLLVRSPGPMRPRRWNGMMRVLALSLSVAVMEQALPEPFGGRSVELVPLEPGPPDPVVTKLLCAFEDEVKAGCPAGRLFVDSLASATAVYLAQRYGVFSSPKPRSYGGLSRERLARVLEYTNVHLAEDLSVSELAGIACISRYHFGKMFRQSMGENVHQYVTRRRIERAKALLRDGSLNLAEIAHAAGFSDQSHFTVVFKRHVEVTPGAYRRAAR